jgi:hypothetical protein
VNINEEAVMSEIKSFTFNKNGAESIRQYKYGRKWPVVYLIENGKELYVGESVNAHLRVKQHLENPQRRILKRVHLISDDEYNKSATLDAEASLIEYIAADGVYQLQNSNGGLQNHNYFDREKYRSKFEILWDELKSQSLAQHDLVQIRNSDLFKYSPYKTLTPDQLELASEILEGILNTEVTDENLDGMLSGDLRPKLKPERKTYLVNGGPGTGKTILAVFLVKQLIEKNIGNVALVIAMGSLRKTLKKVFRGIKGLKPSMVIGPNEVTNTKYEVLIVDEAHRLRQRKNITNYRSFDDTNKKLGLDKSATELDWILSSASKTVLFFDERQSVRPSDIQSRQIKRAATEVFHLQTQMRVRGGENYLKFVDSLLEVSAVENCEYDDYDFRIFDDLHEMIKEIKRKDKEHQLSRVIAGYAWPWNSKKNPQYS